jgi:hypothetical protein
VLTLASANAAPGEERPVGGASLEFNKEDGTLYIDWSGSIVVGMDDLRVALAEYGTTLNRVVHASELVVKPDFRSIALSRNWASRI